MSSEVIGQSNSSQPLNGSKDDPTKVWQEKTKNCQTVRGVKSVALTAFAVLGAVLAGAALSVITAPVELIVLVIALPIVIGCAVLGLTILGFSLRCLYDVLFNKEKHFDNPQTAQKIVDRLSENNLRNFRDPDEVDVLASYGFIKNDATVTEGLKDLITRRNALRIVTDETNVDQQKNDLNILAQDWQEFRNQNILRNLPIPIDEV